MGGMYRAIHAAFSATAFFIVVDFARANCNILLYHITLSVNTQNDFIKRNATNSCSSLPLQTLAIRHQRKHLIQQFERLRKPDQWWCPWYVSGALVAVANPGSEQHTHTQQSRLA
jgi:hypothetical protein